MRILALSTLMVLSSFFASAQTPASATAQNTVIVNITNTITITAKNNSTQTLAVANVSDFTGGVETTSASTFEVSSNKGYTVSVKPETEYFTLSGSPSVLEASKLSVKEAVSGTYQALVYGSSKTVYSTATRGVTTFGVKYTVSPDINTTFDNGTYSLLLTYTATQQ